MLIAQITDTHIKRKGHLAYKRVDTAAYLERAVDAIVRFDPQPDLVVITGDLVDLGRPEEYDILRSLLAPLTQPIVAVPGNHDERDAFRVAFAEQRNMPRAGFIQFAIDDWPVRIVGLDTVVPMQGGGLMCSQRLEWLEATLAAQPKAPTLILMHHPPFATGIEHMDAQGLSGREGFAAVMARHPQVELILCGHLHRHIWARVGGRPAMTAPSTAHQVALDLRQNGPSAFRLEPPAFMLHRWDGHGFVSYESPIGDYEGPYPFFDAMGKLID